MKILVVGGTGTIGQAVVTELSKRHDVIIAAHSRGDIQMDITSQESINAMYKKIGKLDAVVSTTGTVHFEELSQMDETKYRIGLDSKLMGQINLVLLGRNYLHDQGSFTLTSGILNRDPIAQGSSAAMVNGALDGFVKSAAIEMPRGIRINCVSPTVIEEAMKDYESYFRGFAPVAAATAALAYSKSVEGKQTGEIYIVG